ncbi:hypothetical protein ElyMa_003889200 [Elysia marginata]|uniref:Reverse transcriptase domain-containing protein n=1 Tax=Elysia marginata TaxID=1093978 RepID=A0AAV4FM86_9GAST|nr:hypothetical protein ElyMa_003889200 [Elysia marginata]
MEIIYTKTRTTVRIPDGNTDEFDILAGVRQGDTLRPFLFIIVLVFTMRQELGELEVNIGLKKTLKKPRRTQALTLTDLDFTVGLLSILQPN